MESPINSLNSYQMNLAASLKSQDLPSPQKEDAGGPSFIKDEVSISGKGDKVKVQIFPQDPLISKPVILEMDREKIGKNLSNPRIKVEDSQFPVATADSDGNYLYEADDPRQGQVNAFVAVQMTLDMMEKYLGHNIDCGDGGKPLLIRPHEGEGYTAYYNKDKNSLDFNYTDDTPTGKPFYSAQSTETEGHEMGHRILQFLKPGYSPAKHWDSENIAFHEAFADSVSTLLALSVGENLTRLYQETGGDLTRPNLIAKRSEMSGYMRAVNENNQERQKDPYLRTLINDFKYVDIDSLEGNAYEEDKISRQHYSFSRIMSGTFYDCFMKIYDKNIAEKGGKLSEQEIIGAMEASRDTVGTIFARAVEILPEEKMTFPQMAKNMLTVDEKIYGGANRKELSEIFIERKLLTPEECNG